MSKRNKMYCPKCGYEYDALNASDDIYCAGYAKVKPYGHKITRMRPVAERKEE